MKRITSFLLALVMILGLLPMATFAEDTATKPVVHLTADKTTVLAGEEVTLTLTLDGDVNSEEVAAWEWDFIYDSAYFEYASSEVGNAAQPQIEGKPAFAVTPIVNPTPAGDWAVGTYKYASVTSGNKIIPHYLKAGTIATLTLKAKEDIEEDVSSKFYFVPIIVEDSTGTALDVVDADATTNWGKTDFVARTMPADTVGLAVTIAKPIEPITVYMYYADDDGICVGKDGSVLNFVKLTVGDEDGNGVISFADALTVLHRDYYSGGEAGFAHDNGYVTYIWGQQNSYVNYVINYIYSIGAGQAISDGDELAIWNMLSWGKDLYTYFDKRETTATAGQDATFHVNGFTAGYSKMEADRSITNGTAYPNGATVTATCGDKTLTTTTDANGDFTLNFPSAGEWTVLVNGTCSFTTITGTTVGATVPKGYVIPAMMTVTVAEGDDNPNPTPNPEPTASGYTVTMPTDTSAVVNETVEIKPVVGYSDETVTTYNAFDMTFTYDSKALELTSTTEENGPTVTVNNGTIRVQGYGADRTVGTAPFTLTFKALKTGNTSVTVTSAKVDISANAIEKDAPEAKPEDADTTIAVGGYPVNLPEDFTGDSVVEPGEDYTFKATNKNYDYTFSGTTMGGESVNVEDNGDGTFTIENVTGAIDIKFEKTGKTFDVTLGTDMSGANKAQYMTDYEATLTKDEDHYTYDVSVTIGGEKYTGYTVSDGVYTIPGEDITGEIVFTVTRTAITGKYFNVTFGGSGAGDAEGQNSATPDALYSFTLNEETGYKYDVTAKMGNQDASVTEEDGTYTIAKVTGNLVITIEKTLDVTVAVDKFVELDGKTVFLVTATVSLDQGKALTYGGTTMFYSDGSDSTDEMSTGYNAWCYLVIVEENTAFTVQDATDKISVATSEYTTLAVTKDVNESDKVDINDAQLVYDIYNRKYLDFATVSMQKFLNADVNHDRTVNVTDAAAVVAAIQ